MIFRRGPWKDDGSLLGFAVWVHYDPWWKMPSTIPHHHLTIICLGSLLLRTAMSPAMSRESHPRLRPASWRWQCLRNFRLALSMNLPNPMSCEIWTPRMNSLVTRLVTSSSLVTSLDMKLTRWSFVESTGFSINCKHCKLCVPLVNLVVPLRPMS